MRVLFFILFVFAAAVVVVAGQTPVVQRAFDEGTSAAQKNQYERAIEKYRTAELYAKNEKSSDELLARIHFNLGVCLYHLRENKKAVKEFTEAIKLSGRKYRKAFYALGMAQKDLKNWRSAADAFRDSLKLEKTDGEAWFDLAMVYLETDDFGAAEKAFQNAVEYQSASAADAHNNLGVIFALKHEWIFAEREFETALTRSKGKSVEAASNLQLCKFYKENFRSRDWLAKLEFSKIKNSTLIRRN